MFSDKELNEMSMIEKVKLIVELRVLASIMEGNPISRSDAFKEVLQEALQDSHSLEFNKELKQVGDIVKFCNEIGSGYMWEKESLENFKPSKIERKEFMKREAIVIAIDCGKQLLCNHCSNLHKADILISFRDTKEEFYVIWDNIKVIND